MNQEQIEGKWRQVTGSLREKWGELTDNQIEAVAGKKDQLVGLLEEQYGYTKEKAEEALFKFGERLDQNPSYNAFWEGVESGWNLLKLALVQTYNRLKPSDVEKTAGKRDQLVKHIEREYQVSRSEAYELLDDWAYGSIHLATNKGAFN